MVEGRVVKEMRSDKDPGWSSGRFYCSVLSADTKESIPSPGEGHKNVKPRATAASAIGSTSKDDCGSDGENSSGGEPPTAAEPVVRFSEGEKVLAYHGPRIYEAKVQKAEIRKDERKYFVHYLGWNKNWDEWVGAERLLKYNDENITKQRALEKKKHGREKNPKSGRTAPNKPKVSSDTKADKEDLKTIAKGKKRRSEPGVEKDTTTEDKLVKIQIPAALRKQLVDEWELVNQQDKLVELPRSPTVDDILTKYLEYRSKKDGMMTDSIGEILKGLRCYFDKALPVILLYKNERQQYNEAVVDDASPSTIYGAEHLLRLFVKLPELLGQVNIEEETLTNLQQKLLNFLKFLQKNQSTFFSMYEGPKVTDSKGKRKDD